MPIEFTASNLLSFHKEKYLEGDNRIREYIITNGINIFSMEGMPQGIALNNELKLEEKSILKEKHEDVFHINDIVIDEDTLNQWEPEISDFELKNYYDAQQIHKSNFLEEIKAKGFMLKSQNNDQSNDNNKTWKLQNLNY